MSEIQKKIMGSSDESLDGLVPGKDECFQLLGETQIFRHFGHASRRSGQVVCMGTSCRVDLTILEIKERGILRNFVFVF